MVNIILLNINTINTITYYFPKISFALNFCVYFSKFSVKYTR